MKLLTTIVFILSFIVNLKPVFGASAYAPMYSASVTVYDHTGKPLAGVPIAMKVETTSYTGFANGTTNAAGFVYLSLTAPGLLEEFRVWLTSLNYVVHSQANTFTSTSNTLYPSFNLGVDTDGNGITDVWELPLAQKFCPYLILHSGDNGVRPVPVESLDRNGDGVLGWEDVLVEVYDLAGYPHGQYEMDEILLGYNSCCPMSEKYPFLAPIHKELALPDVNGNGIFGEENEAQAIYYMLPHFEWGDIGNTTPASWYSSWSSFIQAHSNESAFVDGTTYANFFKNGSEVVIQYWFFYPFNASSNRHEGDWEHINVVLDFQNPNSASITRVEYYFHEDVTPRYTAGADYYVVSGTHPEVYVGGYTSFDGYSGNGTHGSFPHPGVWADINPIGTNETVDGLGLHIDFGNYQNIVILPELSSISPGHPLEWLITGAYWGHIKSSPSANNDWDVFALGASLSSWINLAQPWLAFIGTVVSGLLAYGYDIGDDVSRAPLGPPTKDSWNAIYNESGASIY